MTENIAAKCLLCGSTEMSRHFYPPNIFRGKTFSYYECRTCRSLSIAPIPSPDDFAAMYGPQDHAYLLEAPDEPLRFDENLDRFHYQRYQLDFFDKAIPQIRGKRLLDYGCGNGFYIAHAAKAGFEGVGIEFSRDFAQLVSRKTGLDVLSFEDFQRRFAGQKFDVIHLGHILEHVPDPVATLEKLKPYARPDTLLLVDGPLEYNRCLSRFLIDTGSRIRRRPSNTYDPQHLSFTTYESQLRFFQTAGFQTVTYKAVEQLHPLPLKPDWRSLRTTALHYLALLSAHVSRLIPTFGNLFHFAGRMQQ